MMALFPLERGSSQVVFVNPYWEYRLDRYRARDGTEHDYHYVHTRGSVLIIPLVVEQYVLVRQYRYLWQRESLEFPGGGILPGVEPIEQAQRELQEEVGYCAGRIDLLGIFNPMNGVTDEQCHVFVASELEPSLRAQDPIEETLPELLCEAELGQAIRDGRLWDGMSLAAWALYCQHRKYT